MHYTIRLFALVVVLLFGHSVAAGPLDKLAECPPIKDAKKRLACFDTALPIAIAVDAATREAEAKFAETRAAEATQQAAKSSAEAEARAAVMAAKKLDSRVGTGISYRDYPQVLSEAKFAIETFIASPAGKANKKIADLLAEALWDYKVAHDVWRIKFNPSFAASSVYSKDLDRLLVDRYPKVESARERGDLRIDRVLPVIWAYASERIADAEKALHPK